MLKAFLWGLIANSSLLLGGLIGLLVTPGKRTLGIIMAFGAGALISAVTYEMVYEAVSLARGTGIAGLGFLAGAFTFFFGDMLIGRFGASGRKAIGASHTSTLVIPLVLAIILDGIPESTVIGLGILKTGVVSMTMLVAVFLSGLPESIASTTGMRSGGWSQTKVLSLWLAITLVCALFTMLGYAFFGNASDLSLAFTNAFAGGAIMMMLANTMMPEAYEHGGKLAGIFTVLGFAVSVIVIMLEHSD